MRDITAVPRDILSAAGMSIFTNLFAGAARPRQTPREPMRTANVPRCFLLIGHVNCYTLFFAAMTPWFQKRGTEWPLIVITAVLVAGIALLAVCSLHILRGMHRAVAHSRAARAVLDKGRALCVELADHPAVLATDAGAESDWRAFSRQVRSLHTIEEDLQYVSVSRDGVTIFHEQMAALDGMSEPRPDGAGNPAASDVRMTRRLLPGAGGAVPVVVFATRLKGRDGQWRVVEVALRRDAVEREEQAAAAAIASMFRLSLLTIAAAFGVCLAIVVWMMQREARRERQRREEEHLAFAGVLANGIVHDFRNPMSSMRLDAQMLEREVSRGAECRPARLSELAERIRHTIDRLDKVFQEFLYASKPPAAQSERVDLKACVRDCLSMLGPRLKEAGVRAETSTPDEDVVVSGYQTSLQRALMNVVTNAEQFAGKGGRIGVRVGRAGREAFVEVTDSGPGIPRADRHRVFEMFYSSRPGGTGLGLFLARTAVERCGGTIRAMENPGGGTCIRIALKCQDPEC